ncbi:MAG TPA: hypothetical protein VFN61_10775 [Acidimicrobiales bacterium]|nr:hypothetical protein [Acidimicrobiales bacterium]
MADDLSLDEVRRLRFLVETQGLINAASLDVDRVMRVVTARAQSITGADAAVVELAEGEDMVYRAASATAAANVGLRLKTASSLSGPGWGAKGLVRPATAFRRRGSGDAARDGELHRNCVG